MESKTYSKLCDELVRVIPKEKIYTDELNRLAYGTDASFYRLIPEIVVKVKNAKEVQFVISKCNEMKIPVTFRAAGTSLSGQAISDSVLMVTERDWRGYKISDDKQFISLEPSVIGSFANAYLKSYDKKIGPDPASINAAMIGGIAANNASGMCCGTAQNSYNTLESMKVILSDGTLLDTGDEESVKSFKIFHKELIDNITELHKEINSDDELAKPRDSKWGTTTRAQKEGLEFGEMEYVVIDQYCKDRIPWFASPWDIVSLQFLVDFNVPKTLTH